MSAAPGHVTATAQDVAKVYLERDGRQLVVGLAGTWQISAHLPGTTAIEAALDGDPAPDGIRFDAAAIEGWDSSVLTFLMGVEDEAESRSIPVNREGLPDGVRRLVELARAVPERGTRSDDGKISPLPRLGRFGLKVYDGALDELRFLGEAAEAFGRFLRGKASYRRSDLRLLIQQAGADALGIASLVSLLFGLILAFVGAVQLQQFGAAIYVADLVGVGMVRDMAAFMTAIIVAGRSGAAYAAQIGTMKVTEEIDALRTTGISPMEFLVVPRIVALVVMMPLLTVYADLMGILGGYLVGTGLLDISPRAYYQQTVNAVNMTHFIPGVIKGTVYGLLVALAGCKQGMDAGSSASAVGDAATKAVVTGVVAIIVACGLAQVISYVFGI
ncbi:MAG: ABC transporter permease [marine benthic group bacterium]|nr:ABC transporter permease [Candidatus Benthicola marisminoris]